MIGIVYKAKVVGSVPNCGTVNEWAKTFLRFQEANRKELAKSRLDNG